MYGYCPPICLIVGHHRTTRLIATFSKWLCLLSAKIYARSIRSPMTRDTIIIYCRIIIFICMQTFLIHLFYQVRYRGKSWYFLHTISKNKITNIPKISRACFRVFEFSSQVGDKFRNLPRIVLLTYQGIMNRSR